ncbi:MAG: hypothetical protein SGI77_26865 [Pirellulaceae bacterium]|nr:hypothetical protein [Pirellulaceae bacterium]
MNTILIQKKVSTLAQVSRHNHVAASLRDAEICESRRDSPTWSYVNLVVTRCFGPASFIDSVNRSVNSRRSRGITLIEILLALGLTVLVTGLIGGLIQIYQGHLEIARDNVRQARLARAVLTMIADDIRGVLRVQSNDDAKTLETFLMSSAASSVMGGKQGGGQQGGGQQGGGQQGGGQQGGGQQGGGQQSGGGGQQGAAPGGSTAAPTDPALADPTTAPLPPGIYGTDTAIEVDISRPPRPDEYIPEMQNLMESKVTDVPSDTKTVSYYIQSPQLGGIQDALSSAVGVGPISSGGLIRRSLDRAVTRWALEQGNIDQISNTGHLLASEIIAISFSYFDGLQWTTTWDSSVQGLPWAIQITIAMQHARQARENPLTPGMSLESLMALPTSETGIETFSTLALVPGAQLLTTPAEKAAADSSTSSPTSSSGF